MDASVIGIFSDIHSNLEALEAVLRDMETLGIKYQVCTGDVVGYGPDPAAVLKKVRSLGCPVIQGNHDEACSKDSALLSMRDEAQAGVMFTRKKLNREQMSYLQCNPLTLTRSGYQFVHASMFQPGKWSYVSNQDAAKFHFLKQTEHVCFCGHTHRPMVWHQETPGSTPTCELGSGKVELQRSGKYLINVGSVGQPRDNDPNACYVIYNAKQSTIEFRRVDYDFSVTRSKIIAESLPDFLGERLVFGV